MTWSCRDWNNPGFFHPANGTLSQRRKKVYDFIEERLRVFPVGVIPLNNEMVTFFSNPGIYQHGKSTNTTLPSWKPDREIQRIAHLLCSYLWKVVTNTFESIKSDLLLFNKNLPNWQPMWLKRKWSFLSTTKLFFLWQSELWWKEFGNAWLLF